MAILSDKWIRDKALNEGMIEPFVEAQRRDGCISYGLSSYGYDARVADDFKIFTNVNSSVVDPRRSTRQLRRPQDRRLRDPAQQLRARPHGRILPRAARRAGDLPRQEHLCAAAGSS
jgi:deoxycytidine triphosphate deaminase